MYGWLNDRRFPAGHLKLYFITALWIPVLPICAFTVDSVDGGFRFYHKMSLWSVIKAFRWRVVSLYFSALFEGVMWLVLFFALLSAVIFAVQFSAKWLFG